MAHNPNRLHVVAKADALVVSIHAFAMTHARHMGSRSPGLRNQLLRAAVSISLNLGEACGYHSNKRAIALLEVAIGSCNEVERVIRLCEKLGILDPVIAELLHEVAIVRAMLYGFRRHLRQPATPSDLPNI